MVNMMVNDDTHPGKAAREGASCGLGLPRTSRMRLICSMSSLPGKSGLPHSISAKMQPALQMSTDGPYTASLISSSSGLS